MPYKDPLRRAVCSAQRHRARRKVARKALLFELGGKCVVCGCNIEAALHVDHVHGGGTAERKKYKNKDDYYKMVLAKVRAGSKDYQILCANHNAIKQAEEIERRRRYRDKPDGWYKTRPSDGM